MQEFGEIMKRVKYSHEQDEHAKEERALRELSLQQKETELQNKIQKVSSVIVGFLQENNVPMNRDVIEIDRNFKRGVFGPKLVVTEKSRTQGWVVREALNKPSDPNNSGTVTIGVQGLLLKEDSSLVFYHPRYNAKHNSSGDYSDFRIPDPLEIEHPYKTTELDSNVTVSLKKPLQTFDGYNREQTLTDLAAMALYHKIDPTLFE